MNLTSLIHAAQLLLIGGLLGVYLIGSLLVIGCVLWIAWRGRLSR